MSQEAIPSDTSMKKDEPAPAMIDEKRTFPSQFLKDKHSKYLSMCLKAIPHHLASLDLQRMTLVFFAISGLDLLGSMKMIENKKAAYIDWIYSMQVLPDKDNPEINLTYCGFRGGSSSGCPFNPNCEPISCLKYDLGHLAATYTALATLVILGDDLSKVNKKAVIEGVRALQSENGSFYATLDRSENDIRFLYCACVVSAILDDFSGINVDKAVKYILERLSYDYGFSQAPGLESHAGYTFLALASLKMLGKLEEALTKEQLEKIKTWCIMRQQSGFQGRPGKPADTCYSYWVGAAIKILGVYDWVDSACNLGFVLSTQSTATGGLAKSSDANADPLHTYMGIAGLALGACEDIQPLEPAMNMSIRAYEHLKQIQRTWNSHNS